MFKCYENGLEGLNWKVDKASVVVRSKEVEGYSAVFRTDTGEVLSIMSDGYQLVQNDIVKELASLIPGEAEAGELSGGKIVYANIAYDSEFRLPGVPDDIVKQRIHIVTSHDGSWPVMGGYTGIRPVCQNTLIRATRESSQNNWFKVRHKLNANNELETVKKLLAGAVNDFLNLKEACSILATTKVTEKQVDGYFESLIDGDSSRAKNARETMKELLEHKANTLDGMKGTLWQAYNAATHYIQHDRSTKGATDEARVNAKVLSNFLGSGAKLTQLALTNALAMAGI